MKNPLDPFEMIQKGPQLPGSSLHVSVASFFRLLFDGEVYIARWMPSQARVEF